MSSQPAQFWHRRRPDGARQGGKCFARSYVEIVQQSFRNSTLYPLATGLSGTLSTVGLQAYGPIASGLSWQSRVAFARASDQFAFDSYNSFAADIWLPWLVSWG